MCRTGLIVLGSFAHWKLKSLLFKEMMERKWLVGWSWYLPIQVRFYFSMEVRTNLIRLFLFTSNWNRLHMSSCIDLIHIVCASITPLCVCVSVGTPQSSKINTERSNNRNRREMNNEWTVICETHVSQIAGCKRLWNRPPRITHWKRWVCHRCLPFCCCVISLDVCVCFCLNVAVYIGLCEKPLKFELRAGHALPAWTHL